LVSAPPAAVVARPCGVDAAGLGLLANHHAGEAPLSPPMPWRRLLRRPTLAQRCHCHLTPAQQPAMDGCSKSFSGPSWASTRAPSGRPACPPHWPASLHLLSRSLLYCRGADDACGVDGHINNAVSCHAQGPSRSHCWCLPVIASVA
jgi:hypothetical protein